MNVPVFRETVTSANLSSVTIAVCAIVPFYEGSIYRIAYGRGFYRSFDLSHVAKDQFLNVLRCAFAGYLLF